MNPTFWFKMTSNKVIWTKKERISLWLIRKKGRKHFWTRLLLLRLVNRIRTTQIWEKTRTSQSLTNATVTSKRTKTPPLETRPTLWLANHTNPFQTSTIPKPNKPINNSSRAHQSQQTKTKTQVYGKSVTNYPKSPKWWKRWKTRSSSTNMKRPTRKSTRYKTRTGR